jgi:uncharacterized membrane protein
MDRVRDQPAGPRAADARGRPGGVGRPSSPTAEAISDDLRRHADPILDRRRRVAGLSLVAAGAMGAVAAYQHGLVRRLPEPPLPVFDAARVDASGEAYALLRMPDASLGLVSYGLTLALAGAGDRNRHRDSPLVPLALAAKVLVDAAGALYLTAEQASKHRRFCSWCLLASAASLATVPQVLPEARLALRALLGRRRR